MNTEVIKDAMKKKSITQMDIVRNVGLAPRTVSRILNGENTTVETLKNLCEFLKIDVCEVIK